MHPLSHLAFMTLGFAGLAGLLALGWFLRRTSNQYAAERALLGSDSGPTPATVSGGALPEIAAVTGIAIIAMAALAIGHYYSVGS